MLKTVFDGEYSLLAWKYMDNSGEGKSGPASDM